MSDYYYKPVLKDDQHLLSSQDNPDRVRGLARDSNNKNPDIIEWERYEFDDDDSNESENEFDDPDDTAESSSRKALIAILAAGLTAMAAVGVIKYLIPKIRRKIEKRKSQKKIDIASCDDTSDSQTSIESIEKDNQVAIEISDNNSESNTRIISEEEANFRIKDLIYHMLKASHQYYILANSRIDSGEKFPNISLSEIAEMATAEMNQRLSNGTLQLSDTQLKEINELLDGGKVIDGNYVPIKKEKVLSLLSQNQ